MRIKEPLTENQKKFILENRRDLTYQQIADALCLASVFKVNMFCKQHDINKKITLLNDDQKDFIRSHHLKMKEACIVSRLGITRFQVQKFKREEGLAKFFGNGANKKTKVREGFFNVDDYKKG